MAKQVTWHRFAQWDAHARREHVENVGRDVLAETAVFHQTSDMLSYHNQLPDLIHLLQTALTELQANDESNEWQQQSITALLMDSLVFQHLASQPPDAPATAPASLVQALQTIVPIDADGLNRYLAHLSGYTQYQWQMEHLAEHPLQNMAALMIEFLAYANREAGLPYGRTNLLRQLLPTYFVERRTGQLTPRQDLGDLMRQGRPLPKPPTHFHPLAPDSDTLQRFLAKLLNYNPVRPYPAAALFTLMPTWLTFLQARQLLTPDAAKSTLDDLANLKPDLVIFFESLAGDDALGTAVSQWPSA
ncbi:MAG: hypothetical protein CL608_33155 [Anaerolineaceae bacterium]|nr:hypothetical protein [Anaerolineaceae bacterium]